MATPHIYAACAYIKMVNPNLNIYQNEAGQTMTSKEIDERYEGELPEAITKVSAHLNELVQLAK